MLCHLCHHVQIMKPTQHPRQRLRLGDTDTVVCLDPTTQRLLKYWEADAPGAGAGGRSSSVFKIDAAFFSERDNVQVGHAEGDWTEGVLEEMGCAQGAQAMCRQVLQAAERH